jgi:predicted small metal-binding protein
MREFKCSSLGYKCNWKHIANTEELLTDIVAVHLRDAHDVKAVSADMVGKIKKAFSNPSTADAAAAEQQVLKEFNCRDLGMDCNWRYIAQTEELMVDGVAVHARSSHGIKEFSPEMMAKVKKLSHEWKK